MIPSISLSPERLSGLSTTLFCSCTMCSYRTY
ncbi:hypothetical protein GECvBGOT_gp197c [Salmonella phage GEC_vB_GOT]|nr:hypothetical protein GECvBGOT_gp197c [Salmonella phage GEC_vB_GOT]